MIRTFRWKIPVKMVLWDGENTEEIKNFTNAVSLDIDENKRLRIEEKGCWFFVDLNNYVAECRGNYWSWSQEQLEKEVEEELEEI